MTVNDDETAGGDERLPESASRRPHDENTIMTRPALKMDPMKGISLSQ